MLRRQEALHVGGRAAVLVGRREQVVSILDTVGGSELGIEHGVGGAHALPGQGLAELPPTDFLALFGLILLPGRCLVLQRRGSDAAQVAFLGHVAGVHAVQHGRMDAGQQPQLADGADRQHQRGGDGLLRPALGHKFFDCTPLLNRRHGFPGDVLHQRAQPVVVGIHLLAEHQHADLAQVGGDGAAHPAVAVDGHVALGHFTYDGRLQDADGAGCRFHLHVRLVGRGLAARVLGVLDQATWVNGDEVHGGLLLGWFVCPSTPG